MRTKGRIIKTRKFCHVTGISNLVEIAEQGLIPHFDNRIGSKELSSGSVINLGKSKKDIEQKVIPNIYSLVYQMKMNQ